MLKPGFARPDVPETSKSDSAMNTVFSLLLNAISSRTAVLLATAILGTTSAPKAQSLDVDVVRDPNADLAIYTATVQAPPGSNATLMLGLQSSFPGVLIPGIFNPLLLNPNSIFALPIPVTVGPRGGVAQFQAPLIATSLFEIPFQAFVIDPLSQLALTNWTTAVHGLGDLNTTWTGGSKQGGQRYELTVQNAVPGAVLRLTVGGQQATATVDLAGSATFDMNANATPGTSVQLTQSVAGGAQTAVGQWTIR